MSKLLMLNMNIFLKLSLSGIHNDMAIRKDLISLTSWSDFYTALIEHNWLQKDMYLWPISTDLNRMSFISKNIKWRESFKISNIGAAIRN